MASTETAPESGIGLYMERAIEDQRRVLWEVQAIIDSVAEAMAADAGAAIRPQATAHYHLALRLASKCLEPVTAALEPITLELRARELSGEATEVSHV